MPSLGNETRKDKSISGVGVAADDCMDDDEDIRDSLKGDVNEERGLRSRGPDHERASEVELAAGGVSAGGAAGGEKATCSIRDSSSLSSSNR